jgi:protein gp37
MASAIEWTEETWNPTTGCDKMSPGCENCYALTLARRLKEMGQPKYQNDGDPKRSGPGFALTLHQDTLTIPLRWKSPKKIFVDSMSDLFHHDVPLAYLQRVFSVMERTPRHTYQILTKRAKRLASIAPVLPWPPNVWMGVSVEKQDYAFRVEELRKVPSAVRFVSVEPMLGPVNLDLKGIDWVVGGGESGANARPMEITWIRSLRDDCVAEGVAFFFKQWGGRTPKSGGRQLDGRTWDEFPGQSRPGRTGNAGDVMSPVQDPA